MCSTTKRPPAILLSDAGQGEFSASQYPGREVQYLLVPPGRIAAKRSTKLTVPGAFMRT
jgi:hypothetical protein